MMTGPDHVSRDTNVACLVLLALSGIHVYGEGDQGQLTGPFTGVKSRRPRLKLLSFDG